MAGGEELAGIDWQGWLARWDRQQTGYVRDREARFSVMLDVLEATMPPSFVALDLACGPGSLSQRLLGRFPQARTVALDIDPVLLAMGQGALGTLGGRIRWVEADLTQPSWTARVSEAPVDAVLTTTALHWLPGKYLVPLYRGLARLLRPGGVLLNGDVIPFGPLATTLQRVADQVRQGAQREAFAQEGVDDWQGWWAALATAEPALAPLLAERSQRFAWREGEWRAPNIDLHLAALHDAGFREVGTIWQHLANRVLMAVR